MEYVSTRNKGKKVSSAFAIASGIAPDGGLYCPTTFPELTKSDWETLAASDYKGRAALVFGRRAERFHRESLRP